MANEIIINAEKDQTRIAIVENGELVELYFENPEHERTLGDIYLGRIRRIMPSIQAAFVDIGQKQDAFLHFSDLAENLTELLEFADQENPQVTAIERQADHHKVVGRRHHPRGKRRGKDTKAPAVQVEDQQAESAKHHHVADARTRGKRRSAQRRSRNKSDEDTRPQHATSDDGKATPQNPPNLLKRNQRILVKISKEPISNKGSRVSTNISLAGRFLVLVPLADYVAVSKKITSYKERRRLRALAKMLLPDGFGVIVRTVASGKDAKSLDTDLRLLLEKWRRIERKLADRPEGPLKVHEDVSMASSIIRDLFSQDYDRILVDQPRMYRNIKNYIQAVAPQMAPAVQLHKGKGHIFEATNIQRDMEEVFESRVELPSGGYLFIERTEAMHVIDVNSGRSGRGMKQEENSLKVNLEAARIVARQVRLRDLGGIIVIDFIDMRAERNKKKVYDELRNQFRTDRAVTKILPMSDFGLMQITRQRLRPSITTTFSGPDARTNGTPNIETPPATPERQQQAPQQQQERRPRPARTSSRKISPDDLLKEMEQWIVTYKTRGKRDPLQLLVHPFTAAYLTRKIPNHPTRWFLKHRIRLRIEIDRKMDPMSYRFFDVRSGKDVTNPARNRQDAPSQKSKKKNP